MSDPVMDQEEGSANDNQFVSFAVAGEISGASSMILEHSPFGRRGFFASFTLQGVQAGQILAAMEAATPPCMSTAPRPHIMPSAISALKGSKRQLAASPGGTTSV